MATIFSGMQPTGELHLGNYFGALRQWVKFTNEGQHQAFFSVVDAHALTVDYDAKTFAARVENTALAYLAGGLDPEKCTLFVQSEVREHTELAWYLTTCAPMGELGRMTQFKEKSKLHDDKADDQQPSINTGLFSYPILMAADILLYKGTLVPVGADQVQHLEFARDLARHFNKRFRTKLFPQPKPYPLTLRIRGVDGAEKMSKSRGNAIGMLDSSEQIAKKLKGAFTDPQRVTADIPGRPEICNIFTMHGAVSSAGRIGEVETHCRTAALGCGDCKKLLHESLESELVPIRLRAQALEGDRPLVRQILRDGSATCRSRAAATMKEVREAMGLYESTL